MSDKKHKIISEFGDFQTPDELANEAVNLLYRLGHRPNAIIEPTCGKGAFLLACFKSFPNTNSFLGVEINKSYLEIFRKKLIEVLLNYTPNILMSSILLCQSCKVL